MALPISVQLRYWGIATVVLFLVLWWLGDAVTPFILGGAIAYCMDPIADRLERYGFSRVWATTLISVVALMVFVVLALLVIPTLINQAIALVEIAPTVVQDLQSFLIARFPSLMEENSVLRDSLVQLGDAAKSQGIQLAQKILSSVTGLINVVVFAIIVPVVAFYLLLDWDKMVSRVDQLLPRDHRHTIRYLAVEMDKTLASFIRGQGTVCLILGTFYAVALMLVGLQFGLVVGVVAGALTFIPYVGALVGGVLAIGLALFQFWGDWVWIVAVAIIFQVGQLVEGNILTPKLVGSSVGLHPVWLLFALSAFGLVFGFVGVLVAVPVAALIGVLVRFVVDQYQLSPLYLGLERFKLNEDNEGDQ